jgi:hypothetical protein
VIGLTVCGICGKVLHLILQASHQFDKRLGAVGFFLQQKPIYVVVTQKETLVFDWSKMKIRKQ